MPTNLPAEAIALEKLYKEAETTAEKIRLLEELISAIPKHKGTDKLRANYRKRLSKMKVTTEQSTKKGGQPVSAFVIDPEGAGQVVIIGPANVGKSALVATTTNADPEVAVYPFTTWTATPGMMAFENTHFQLVDTPPLDREFIEPELIQLIRNSDLVLLMVDLLADPVQQLEDTVATLEEHRMLPLHMKGRPTEVVRPMYKPLLVVCNKNDDEGSDENFDIFCELLDDEWPLLCISVNTGRNVDELRRAIFERLNMIRVYSQAPGKDADLNTPFLLEEGSTVEYFAGKVHKDFSDKLKSARVWGSGDFDGQMVSRDYILQDGDVVELKI